MKLSIEIRKEYNKPSILTCTREDGSTTYAKVHPNFEMHDIAHYVVEMTLAYKKAFYGLLCEGFNITDFQLPKEQRPEGVRPANLAPEALITEHLVMLLQTDMAQPLSKMDVLNQLTIILKENDLPFPDQLDQKMIDAMKLELHDLMKKWFEIPYGQSLHLEFVV